LPGDYLYVADILGDPELLDRLGTIMAAQFIRNEPDFVLTVETRGIAFAMATARALGVPLAIARRDQKVYEGPQVAINFISASTGVIQTMSLAKRTVKKGQRALIIDDFMKAGGTVRGMVDLMSEFDIDVVGIGVMIRRAGEKALPERLKSLMTLEEIDGENGSVVSPASWLTANA
jgi:purine operon repressor